jgi:hypothetical protein
MAAAHYVFYSTTSGRPSHCAAGKKAEKAIADIAKASLSYTARETRKEDCPFCTPKAAPEVDEEPERPAEIPDENPILPGQCHKCRSGDAGRLSFENRILIRTCLRCGARFNLVTLQPMEG